MEVCIDDAPGVCLEGGDDGDGGADAECGAAAAAAADHDLDDEYAHRLSISAASISDFDGAKDIRFATQAAERDAAEKRRAEKARNATTKAKMKLKTMPTEEILAHAFGEVCGLGHAPLLVAQDQFAFKVRPVAQRRWGDRGGKRLSSTPLSVIGGACYELFRRRPTLFVLALES